MFDVLFEGMKAFNQSFMLVGGFVFLLIGGGLAGYEIYWRSKGVAVKGRVIGVRASNAREFDDEEIAPEYGNLKDENNKEDEAKGVGKGSVIVGLLFFAFPLLFAVLGANMGYKYLSLTASGVYTEATVVRNEASSSSGNTSYYAVVEFRDHNGRLWELEDNVGGGSPSFKKGETIGVYYDENDPERFVIHAFWHYMGIAIIFFVIGSSVFGLLVFLYLKNKAEEAAKKQGNVPKKKKLNYANEMYYPVYEYQDIHGERKENVGMVGSNSLLNAKLGKAVNLLILPDNPDQVRKSSWLFLVFGTVFILPGLFFFYIAFTQYESTPLSFVFVIMVIAFIVFRMFGSLGKVKAMLYERAVKGGLMHSYESSLSGNDDGAVSNGRDILKIIKKGVKARVEQGARLLNPEEIVVRAKKQAGQARIAGYVLLLLAVGCSIGSYYSGLDMLNLTLSGQYTSGKVTDVNSRRSSTSSGSSGYYTYHAVVAFKDAQNRLARFEDSVGSSNSIYDRGDSVQVLYDPANPHKAIIDRGVLNWGISGGLALGALILLLMGISSLNRARIHGGMRYQTRI